MTAPGRSSPVKGNATKDAVWFRRTIEVPKTLHGYDLTGTRIWFQFHANANGPMPEIVYFNGRRVALGDDLEPIVLFDDAKPGDKVLVAVKLLQTVDDKRFNGVTTKIDFAENRPSPDDLRNEFLSAAVLVPSLAPRHRPRDIDTLDQSHRRRRPQRAHQQRPGRLRRLAQSLAIPTRSPQAPPQQGHLPPHRQLPHRRRMALAVDGNRRRRQAHLRHRRCS